MLSGSSQSTMSPLSRDFVSGENGEGKRAVVWGAQGEDRGKLAGWGTWRTHARNHLWLQLDCSSMCVAVLFPPYYIQILYAVLFHLIRTWTGIFCFVPHYLCRADRVQDGDDCNCMRQVNDDGHGQHQLSLLFR